MSPNDTSSMFPANAGMNRYYAMWRESRFRKFRRLKECRSGGGIE